MTPNFLQPNQPVNILTPVDHIKRCFLLSWYTFFQWLECDQLNDLAFCYPCKNFGSGEALKDNFVSLGYKNWKNVTERFRDHEASNFHKISEINNINNKILLIV